MSRRGWDPETLQVHVVAAPGGCRTQLTFFDSPVHEPTPIPGDATSLFYLMDSNGTEKWQIYKHVVAG